MKVKVLSIKPAQAPNSHEVLLSIGEERQIFMFTTEVNRVGAFQLQNTHAEPRFSELFKFNQRVAMNVSELVVKNYKKEVVELPAYVGNFVTPEEALSKLKPFEYNRKQAISDGSKEGLINREQRSKMNHDIRHKAMALIEQLPEDLLDEAVIFLESLYVKANN
ncbi:MAG: hypothetical protein EBE86_035510 [Hormoscilla sp. GUM202]|nr:hypothetical protein [Hormoscilla sp. GUM202]